MVMVVGLGGTFLYDVGDPLHPHVVCRISNTPVPHILSGTSFGYLMPEPNGATRVVMHALGSNQESVAATFAVGLFGLFQYPLNPFSAVSSWPPDATVLAYSADGPTGSNGLGTTEVWVASSSNSAKLYSYSSPSLDGFGRPGPPPPTLAVSSDGAYLVAGWAIGSGLHVFRLSDRADVSPPMPGGVRGAVWSRTGHVLYIVGDSRVEAWTPETGVSSVIGTIAWTLQPSFSSDGSQVAFTAVKPDHQIRVYVYDFKTNVSRLLIDQPRSTAMFVKAGWVWYLEEKTCGQSTNHVCFDPTEPTGNVLAMNLATGQESPVTFAAGEAPVQTNWTYMAPGDVWPLG